MSTSSLGKSSYQRLKGAPDGYLSPYQQMKACVLYDVLKDRDMMIQYKNFVRQKLVVV